MAIVAPLETGGEQLNYTRVFFHLSLGDSNIGSPRLPVIIFDFIHFNHSSLYGQSSESGPG